MKSERVYTVEGATYFCRSGPQTVDGLQILAEIMHPELFPRRSRPNESGDLGPKVPTGEREGPLIRDDSVGTRLAHVPAFMLQAT
ncbi:MAG: hypothetical protein DMD77_18765 [Candidatus Rokuibacteriota bacterium]|nr:MAG: hypothetical protein DMD77_18765 [Candidatus Rokubacteria bacterium]